MALPYCVYDTRVRSDFQIFEHASPAGSKPGIRDYELSSRPELLPPESDIRSGGQVRRALVGILLCATCGDRKVCLTVNNRTPKQHGTRDELTTSADSTARGASEPAVECWKCDFETLHPARTESTRICRFPGEFAASRSCSSFFKLFEKSNNSIIPEPLFWGNHIRNAFLPQRAQRTQRLLRKSATAGCQDLPR